MRSHSIFDSPDFARRILDDVPISLWIEDFTYPEKQINMLRTQAIDDFRKYFLEHPEFVHDCLEHTEVIAVNRETLRLTGAETKEVLTGPLSRSIHSESMPVYRRELLMLARGEVSIERELPARNLRNEEVILNFKGSFYKGPGERTFLLISMNDYTRRARAEKMLKASLAEKDLLLKEIHHRVKNNLSIVSNLIRIFAAQKGWEDVDEITDRIQAIAGIHRSIYLSDNPSQVDFKSYLRDIITSLTLLYGTEGITIKTSMSEAPFFFTMSTAVPLGLIVTELITNARKHAFRESGGCGEIRVELDDNEMEYRLAIADNGTGLPAEPFDSDGEHIGMTLTRTLVAQIDGRLEYRYENGAVFTLHIPHHKK